jgi:hypothetical protein
MRIHPLLSVAISNNSLENSSPLGSDLIWSRRVMITWPVEIDGIASVFVEQRSTPGQSIFTYWRELHVAIIIRSVGRDFKDYLLATRGRHGPKQRRRQKQVG